MRSSDWSSDVCSSDLAGRRWIAIRVHHAVDPIDVAGDSNVVHNLAVEAGIQRVVRVQRLARSAPDPGAQARELPCTVVLDDKGAATVTTPQHAFKRQACGRRIESIPEIALTYPGDGVECAAQDGPMRTMLDLAVDAVAGCPLDRKSTRLNSSH